MCFLKRKETKKKACSWGRIKEHLSQMERQDSDDKEEAPAGMGPGLDLVCWSKATGYH